jgi:hypothetical protein
MSYAQNKPFIMPDWTRRSTLASPAVSGGSTIVLADAPSWVFDGRALFLFDGRTRPTPVYVASMLGSTVTLADPLSAAWPAGTIVLPGPVGLLVDEIDNSSPVNGLAVVKVNFKVEPGSEPYVAPPAAPVTYNGFEVCTFRPNWANSLTQNFIYPMEQVDYDRGPVANFFPYDFPSRSRRASFTAMDEAEGREFEEFFDRMKGQRGEFYMPTGVNDLPPLSDLASGTATLTVADTLAATYYSNSKVFKALAVQMRDGTFHYRLVNSLVPSGGNTVITVNTNWPSTLAASDIVMISWMPVWRFASDTLTMDWLTNSVARLDLPMRTLEQLTAE